MFRNRLTWFWGLLTGIALVLVIRLLDIQVVHADAYEDLATRLLTRPVRYLRAPRGSILDRHGRVLVSHEPSFDVSVRYEVLTGESRQYLRAVARQLLRDRDEKITRASIAEVEAELRLEISDMWRRLSELTGRSVSDFVEQGERLRARVERIRAGVRRRTGLDQRVGEERWFHPLLSDVDDDVALTVRLELERLPWLSVVPGSRRVAHEANAVVHLLGRLGAVSEERLEQDPLRGDPLRELHPTDRCGLTGVERLAETTLRGTRGRIEEEFDGTQLEHIYPLPGDDVTLTLDMELQEQVIGILADAIDGRDRDGNPHLAWPAGGSAVVIDVATREILALVSYPIYPYDRFSEDYGELIRDARRLPTRFRAVNGRYPPGSTCKAITLMGALSDGVTSEHERIHCTGHLLPEQPRKFRCWIYNQYYPQTHDWSQPEGQNGEDAIRNSCNIYFYKMGGRLGPDRLCHWFSQFGLGRSQGTGLIEESAGVVPTAAYLQRAQGREAQPSDAWNWSIGQGEVTATPLQVANVCASIAAGYWAPVQLLRGPGEIAGAPAQDERTAFQPDALRVLRKGMWRVVNERGGTAYKHARLGRDDYVLCGKTGSAQAVPQPVEYRYTFEWPDGRRDTVDTYLEADALARFGDEKPERVGKHTQRRYPDLLPGELKAHAWFMGYTQTAATPPGAAPQGRSYAIAVIIEYGESGGRVAGPVGRQIAEWLLDNR